MFWIKRCRTVFLQCSLFCLLGLLGLMLVPNLFAQSLELPILQKKVSIKNFPLWIEVSPADPYLVASYNIEKNEYYEWVAVVRMFDLRAEREVWHHEIDGQEDPYASIKFSADGRNLAISHTGTSTFFWVLRSDNGQELFRQPVLWPKYESQFALPNKTILTSDHRLVATEISQTGVIGLISSESNKVVGKLRLPHSANNHTGRHALSVLNFSADEKLIYAADNDEFGVWDVTTQRPIRSIKFSEFGEPNDLFAVQDAFLSADSRFLAIAYANDSNSAYSVVIVNTQTGLKMASFPVDGIARLHISSSNKVVTAITGNGAFYRYDIYQDLLMTKGRFFKAEYGANFYLSGVGFSRDGTSLVTNIDRADAQGSNHFSIWSLPPN